MFSRQKIKFKNILLISYEDSHKEHVLSLLKKHRYNVFCCLPKKEEINKMLIDNIIEIVILTSTIPFKERCQLCKWLYSEFPTKLYFFVIYSENIINCMYEAMNCKLLQKDLCKAAFLYSTREKKLVISRFRLLIQRNTMSEIGKISSILQTLLSVVVKEIGMIPFLKTEMSRYLKSDEINVLVKNLILEICENVKKFFVKYFNVDKFSLFLYDFVEDKYVLSTSYNYKITQQPVIIQRSWGLINKVIKTKTPMLIQDGIVHYPEYQKLKIRPQPEIVSSMIFPLLIVDYLIGVINLARFNPSKERFTKFDFYLCSVFVEWLSYIFSVLLSFKLALEYEKLKSDFIAIVNHELRTPLMALSAAVELVEKELPQNISEILKRNINRLDSLLLSMLDFSRIGRGTFKVIKKEYSVKKLVDEIVKDYIPIMNKANIKFLVETEDIHPDIIMFDQERIKQILSNYLNNAIKFSSEEKKERYIKFVIKDEDKFVHFYVEDNGIGIKKEDIKKLFTPFIQVGDILTSHKPGLGLGLYISSEIAKQHQGKIWIESEYGEWTRVHLLLPKKQYSVSGGGEIVVL